ncbi:MAG TPA: hypothetical protein DCP92_20315 [Nitrospiraceae bacterium]|jgi:hypothetical protein|nr:hypothetical protein [Nitrospiraceae bacterium]
MKKIVHIAEETFEQILQVVRYSEMIDLRECTSIEAYGIIGILETGERALSALEEHFRYEERACVSGNEPLCDTTEWKKFGPLRDCKE